MKTRKLTNIFVTIPIFQLETLVKESDSLSEIFEKLNLCKTGPQYKKLKARLEELKIDTSHFKKHYVNGKMISRPITFYLIQNSPSTSTSTIKRRLIKEGLLKNECHECKNTGQWNSKPLSLQLDHINGIRNDNRLENLRILCPNCHSQTHTYSGKKHKVHRYCDACGVNIRSKTAINCRKCANKLTYRNNTNWIFKEKIAWPPKEELEKLVWTKTPELLAKDCNASENGLRRHCEKIGVSLPPCGYWIRIKNGYSHEKALNPPPKPVRPRKKLFSFDELEEIKNLINEGILSFRDIGKKFNVHHASISRIAKGTGYSSDKTRKTMERYVSNSLT